MLLAVDIGNTNINCALFSGEIIKKRFIIPTSGYSRARLKRCLVGHQADTAVICSVVPEKGKLLRHDLEKYLHWRVLMVGEDLIVPLKNLYRNPGQVGQDRLVGAYAAVKLYAAPVVVIDFGTAVTFDAVSKNSAYLGGMIIPGLRTSLACLAEKTALLPKITLALPREVIGRDTRSSMLSGVVRGFAGSTETLARQLKAKVGKKAKVVGTGGDVKLVSRYCHCFDRIKPDLVLYGLALLYTDVVSLREAKRRSNLVDP